MNPRRAIGAFYLLALLIGCLGPSIGTAAEAPIPPAPARWVTDTAGFISSDARASLDQRLEAYDRDRGHQILIWIGKSTGDAPIDDWAVRAFKAWRVGRAGIDDGLVLFVMSDDRKLRIEVGYGLEGIVPDAIASRIINDEIVPRIKEGKNDEAVTAGVDAILKAIDAGGSESLSPQGNQSGGPQPVSLLQKIIFALIFIGILIFAISNPTLAFWILMNIMASSRGGSSGGSGRGGFSGGGGRSGGGGASGSW